MVMNESERQALKEKLNNQEKVVKCPRCGNELFVEKRGNSIAVECCKPKSLYIRKSTVHVLGACHINFVP